MNRDTDILARTIYGEARGESISGTGGNCLCHFKSGRHCQKPRPLLVGQYDCRRLPCAVAVFLLEQKRSQPEDYRTGR